MNKIESWFNLKSDLGLLAIRLFIGFRIVYGVFDNIISWNKMIEFSDFLKANSFPVPTFCAILSVYAQFFCSILISIGYKTRFAAFILMFNFIVAIVMVHSNDSIEIMTPALAMLFINLGLMITGAGKWSFDKLKFE